MDAHHRKLFIRKWTRTLHIYISMLGLLLMVFFSATGIMLNHEEWFGYAEPRMENREGTIPAALLEGPDKLAIVELLRKDLGATGALDSFEMDEDELRVVFKSPGRRAEAVVTLPDGAAEVSIESHGFAGRLVELHRGVDAGEGWRFILDVSSVLFLFIGVSGLVLWMFVPRWRPVGLAAVAVCVAACAAVYFMLVP